MMFPALHSSNYDEMNPQISILEDDILKRIGVIFLWGPIDQFSVMAPIKYILAQNAVSDPVQEIRLVINSSGGDLNSAIALIDVMRMSTIPIHTIGLGEIISAGLLIFINGARGKRSLTQNTQIMSHQFTAGTFGKQHELYAAAQEFEAVKEKTIQIYKDATKLSRAKIIKYLLPETDVYLTAQQAIQHGLADRVIKTIIA